jgi:hypothetical protein
MVGGALAGVGALLAGPMAGGLMWRRVRQRRMTKLLEITSPNGLVEQRFVRVGGIDQWIQIRAEDRDNRS